MEGEEEDSKGDDGAKNIKITHDDREMCTNVSSFVSFFGRRTADAITTTTTTTTTTKNR